MKEAKRENNSLSDHLFLYRPWHITFFIHHFWTLSTAFTLMINPCLLPLLWKSGMISIIYQKYGKPFIMKSFHFRGFILWEYLEIILQLKVRFFHELIIIIFVVLQWKIVYLLLKKTYQKLFCLKRWKFLRLSSQQSLLIFSEALRILHSNAYKKMLIKFFE